MGWRRGYGRHGRQVWGALAHASPIAPTTLPVLKLCFRHVGCHREPATASSLFGGGFPNSGGWWGEGERPPLNLPGLRAGSEVSLA